jgi:predicted NACHT family NTPase
MKEKRPFEQQAQGMGIAQAEGGGQATVNIHQAPAHSKAQNRQQMLAKVRSDWITGRLEQSLHEAALIDLGLLRESDAVANPWRFVVQESNRSAHPLPQGTPIAQVYDEAGRELLILGEAGSGKTTLLLQLARHLLDRAEQDESHPMPVVFNLSPWAVKKRPFAVWLVDELQIRYCVPRKLARMWVAGDQILPLLDGLDEVQAKDRAACIESINAYRRKHSLLPLVVCCRNTEYAAISACVSVRHTVTILPLTDEQIADYFQETPGRLKILKYAVQQDEELGALVRLPLMLTIFTLAYQSAKASDLPVGLTAEATWNAVLATYVEQMLARRGQLRGGTPRGNTRAIPSMASLLGKADAGPQSDRFLTGRPSTRLASRHTIVRVSQDHWDAQDTIGRQEDRASRGSLTERR